MEAGEHCQRHIDPYRYGMELKKTRNCNSTTLETIKSHEPRPSTSSSEGSEYQPPSKDSNTGAGTIVDIETVDRPGSGGRQATSYDGPNSRNQSDSTANSDNNRRINSQNGNNKVNSEIAGSVSTSTRKPIPSSTVRSGKKTEESSSRDGNSASENSTDSLGIRFSPIAAIYLVSLFPIFACISTALLE